jgi:alpha-galactosidase/6-phospho-beta-glucosidase family protein
LSDYRGDDLTSVILDTLSVNLEESWTDDYDFYTQTTIPCSKQKLFRMFDEMSDAVHDYIIGLAEDNCYEVEELIEDEEDDEYEEKRTRMETRYSRNVRRRCRGRR